MIIKLYVPMLINCTQSSFLSSILQLWQSLSEVLSILLQPIFSYFEISQFLTPFIILKEAKKSYQYLDSFHLKNLKILTVANGCVARQAQLDKTRALIV